jgi:hypothetical protein
MSSANPSSSRPIPLGYGRAGRGGNFRSWLSAGVNERVDGVAQFLGMLVGAAGGARQLGLAFGLACVGNGVGLLFDHGFANGHTWIAGGAFILGLVLPVPRRRS